MIMLRFYFFSLAEANRHTINCYPQENALQKPRNLKKLEKQHQSYSKTGTGAQFTVKIHSSHIFF